MLSSYLKQAAAGSNHRARLGKAVAASYSSGSDFSDDDTSDYSSSILSVGSSAASPASASEPSSWKERPTFSSTQDEGLDDDDDNDRTIILSDVSSTMGTESMTILPSLLSDEDITSPKPSKRRLKTGRPRRETFRPAQIKTLTSPQFGIDALCSGVPIDCRSLDSQISILDRACDDVNIDDFASGQCVNKLIEAERKRSVRKRERAIAALQRASMKWEECRDENDDTTNLDEVEIVFDRSINSDERSGSLWNGLTLWEVNVPGSSPKHETLPTEKQSDVMGSNVIVFSPVPSLRELPRKSPRIDCTMQDNSTIPTETSAAGKLMDARMMVSNCGQAISSKLKRRGRSADANSLKGISNSVDSLLKERPFSSPSDGTPQCTSDGKNGRKKATLHAAEGSHGDRDASVPLVEENEEPDALQSLASSDDDERKPALNIFLTRVPVHPETPSKEGQRHEVSLGTKDSNSTRTSRVATASVTAKSPSRLDQLKKLFQESNRKVGNDSMAGKFGDSVEVLQEDNGVELRSNLAGNKIVDVAKSRNTSQRTSTRVDQVEVDQRTKTTTGCKTACLYDSEGNTISPGALKRIELAPKTPRDVKSSSRSRSVASESRTTLAENGDSSGRIACNEPRRVVAARETSQVRPSVRDLVKAINEKEEGGEKKKVLRIFSSSHKRNSKDATSRMRSERQTSRSLPPAPPLRRSYVSDLGPRRSETPTTNELKEVEISLRRSVSLSKSKVSEFEHPLPFPSPVVFDENSILESAENAQPFLQDNKTTPDDTAVVASVKLLDKASPAALKGKSGRPIVDVVPYGNPPALAPIEFSPIEFPIVSKQICSTDRLTREFIIQGTNQDAPVVLYPLLDFNPCYEVFILPSDGKNHTFEKKQTLKTPSFLASTAEKNEKKPGKKHTPRSLRSSTRPNRGVVASNGTGDGGIEVALAESHRAHSIVPNGKQLLGYVSHSSRTDLRHETKEESSRDALDQSLHDRPESTPSSVLQNETSQVSPDCSGQERREDGEVPNPEGKDENDNGTDNSRSLPSFLSKPREPHSETGTEDAVFEPSIEVNGSHPTNHITRPKKHVTFRNWNVPSSFTTPKPKSQSSQPKSILRASNSGVLARIDTPNVLSAPDTTPNEVISAPTASLNATKTSPNGTPKTSNRFANPSKGLVDRLTRRSKTKCPDFEKAYDREDREPISSIRSEKPNQVDRTEPEGFEVERDSHLLLAATGLSVVGAAKTSLWSKARREKNSSVRYQEQNSRSVPGPNTETPPSESFRITRTKKETDTSTMMATVGDATSEGDLAAESNIQITPSILKAPKRPEIPEKLPLAPSAEDEFGFLDDSPPPTDGNRCSRGHKRELRKGERSASLERVSRWISGMRPSSQYGAGLSKRDRQKILQRNNKATRRFDDSALFRKSAVPIEKEVYNLLMEGNKTQEDIYQTLTEIAIARKRPNQSLAQAMNELEREVFQVYSEKCREKSENKLARRRDFDRKLMRAIRKKTERVVREENEKVRRHRDGLHQEPSLFQEAIDFFSSFVICVEDVGLSPRTRRTPLSPSRRTKTSCLSSPDEDFVYTPKSDKRTFFA